MLHNHFAAYYEREPNSLVIANQRNDDNRLPSLMAMYLLQTRGGHQVSVIGERFGYTSYGGVARTLHQIRRRIQGDEHLQHDVANLTEMIQTKKTT